MGAKDIRIEPISRKDAHRIIPLYHYSKSPGPRNSKLYFGVFMGNRCGGAISFGPPTDVRKNRGSVTGTRWNGFLEINRMAFADWLPRNSESRALGYCLRLIRKSYPHVEWVQTYADATQCGDGTIYRAAGFKLVAVRPNKTMYRMPDGAVLHRFVFDPSVGSAPAVKGANNSIKSRYGCSGTECATKFLKRIGAECLPGFQLRYIKMLDGDYSRLTIPILPYSEIERRQAGMYKGQPRAGSVDSGTPSNPVGKGRCNSDPRAPLEDQ